MMEAVSIYRRRFRPSAQLASTYRGASCSRDCNNPASTYVAASQRWGAASALACSAAPSYHDGMTTVPGQGREKARRPYRVEVTRWHKGAKPFGCSASRIQLQDRRAVMQTRRPPGMQAER